MKAMKTKIIVLSLIITSLASIGFGAIGSWTNYTYMRDSRGIASDGENIWCITSGGLVGYNIQSGEINKLLNSDGLGDIDLISIEVDSGGVVYIGGNNATLSKIEPDGRISVDHYQFSNEIIYSLNDMQVAGNILWVATDAGVAKYLTEHNGGEFQETYSNLGDLPREIPVNAVLSFNEYIWAGTDSGLAYTDTTLEPLQNPANWNTITRGENGLTESRIKAMALAVDTIFVGTTNGVFQLRTDSLWQNIGLTSLTIYDLEYLNDILTAATNNGVYQRVSGVWQLLTNDSLLNDNARGVTLDSQGNLWGAFETGSFAQYDSSFWEVVTIDGPVSNRIQNIAIDSSGTIWLAHTNPGYGGSMGVSKFDGVTWTNYNYQNSGLGGNAAVVIEYDYIHDLVWFGSWGDGLISFDGDSTWNLYDETNSPLLGVDGAPSYVPIPDISIDDQGNIWALNMKAYEPDGDNGAMGVFNPTDSSWLYYRESPGQIADHFRQVVYVYGDTAYICGELTNIDRVDFGPNAVSSDDDNWLDQIQSETYTRELLMDDGKLYLANASGLYYYDFAYQQMFSLELPDGYRSAVNCIAMDGLGNKWVGTDSGVVVLAGSVEPGNPNWKDGFKPANSFLLGTPVISIAIDKATGLVYIGTLNGLSVYESGYATPSADLNDMAVYPNPVYASDDAVINFLRVPADAEISIYTVAGDLIKKINYQDINYWDLKNENGRIVAAGVYMFYVKSGDKSGIGKFAVIR